MTYRGRSRGLGRRSRLKVGEGTPPRRTRGAALRSASHLDVAGQLILAKWTHLGDTRRRNTTSDSPTPFTPFVVTLLGESRIGAEGVLQRQ